MSKTPIRVLIVDDHAIMRQGLRGLLSVIEDILLVGEAPDGRYVLPLTERLKPDVILMDLKLPRRDGAEVTAQVMQRFPWVKVLALTSYEEAGLLKDVLAAGAVGYLLKDVDPQELLSAIRRVYHGESVVSPVVAPMLEASDDPIAEYHLTEREVDVLRLMCEGMSNAEIAVGLSISPLTVKTHVRNIFAKMHVSSRTEAAILAIQRDMFHQSP